MKIKRKIKLLILSFLLVFTFSIINDLKSDIVLAQSSPKLEVIFSVNGQRNLTKTLLESNAVERSHNKGTFFAPELVNFNEVPIEVTFKGFSSEIADAVPISAFQMEFNENPIFSGITKSEVYTGNGAAGDFYGQTWDVSGNSVDDIARVVAVQSPNQNDIQLLNNNGIAFIMYVNYTNIQNLEDFNVEFQYIDGGFNKGTVHYTSEDILINPLIIGDPTSGPDASLSSLEINGSTLVDGSVMKYESSIDTVLETGNINISYQDSINGLSILPTQSKLSAEVNISVNDLPYDSTVKLNTGDVLKVVVNDGKEQTKTYTRTINVTDANSETDVTITTNKDNLDVTSSILGDQINVVVPYSVTDINITAKTIDVNAKIDNDLVSITGLAEGENLRVGTYNVTAEDGRTTQEYIVNVTRTIRSVDTDMTLSVDSYGVPVGSANIFSYTILENKSNFSFTITTSDVNAQIRYKLSDATEYKPAMSNTTIPHLETLAKGSTVTYDIEIIAENPDKKTSYKLVVKREKSTNNDLEKLQIQEGTNSAVELVMSGGGFDYTIRNNDAGTYRIKLFDKPNEIQTVQVFNASNVQINDSTQNISDLSFGANTFKAVVTSQSGQAVEYPITIYKKSDANELTSIVLQDGADFSNIATMVDFIVTNNTYVYNLEKYSTLKQFKISLGSSDKSKFDGASNNTFNINDQFPENGKAAKFERRISIVAENGSPQEYLIVINRPAADANNLLTSLSVGDTPVVGFEPIKNTYDTPLIVDRELTSISVLGVPQSSLATVKYYIGLTEYTLGQISLTLGKENLVEIRVTAESGDVKSYYVKIIPGSEGNQITNVTLNNIPEFIFERTKYTYNIEVPYTVKNTSAYVEASEYATITGNKEYILSEGKNITIKIFATSETGVKGQEYTIIIKQNSARTYKDLSSLIVTEENGTPLQLIPGELGNSFSFRVENDVNFVDLSYKVNGSNGEVIQTSIGNRLLVNEQMPLKSGLNTYTIIVKDEAGGTKNYTLNITKASDNNKITSIIINDDKTYNISEFIGNNYSLPTVPFNTDFLNIKFILEDGTAVLTKTPNIANNKWDLKVGINTISFYATSQYGTKGTTYSVSVERQAANQLNDLSELIFEVTYNNGELQTINSLNDFELANLINLRFNRDVINVKVIAKVSKFDRSIVNNFGKGIIEGDYLVFTKVYSSIISGNTNQINLEVKAEDPTLATNDYAINIVSKNAIKDIVSFELKNGNDILHSSFSDANLLKDLPYSTNQLVLNIEKLDKFSRLYINNIQVAINEKVLNYAYMVNDGLNEIKIEIRTDIDSLDPANKDYASEIKTITFNRTLASTTAELESLEVIIDGVNQIKDFISTNYIYDQIRVDRLLNPTASINAVAKDNGIVKNAGGKILSIGKNEYIITVTSEDGSVSKEYKIVITQNNDDNKILDIKAEDMVLDQVFNENTLAYTLPDVKYDVNNIKLNITKSDEFAKVFVNGAKYINLANLALQDNVNTFSIYVESDLGTKGKVYTVTINRTPAYKNINLSDLYVTDENSNRLEFNEGVYQEGKYNYLIRLPQNASPSFINIKALLLDEIKQSLLPANLNNIQLTYEPNGTINQNITFNVNAEDGATQKYTIIISKGVTLSSDVSFDSIEVTDDFNDNYLTYFGTGTIDDPYLAVVPFRIDRVNINLLGLHNKANYTPSSQLLKAGEVNVVKVVVTAEDKTKSDIHYIEITRKAASSDSLLKDITIKTPDNELILGVESLNPTKEIFESNITGYTITLDRSYKQIILEYTKSFEDAVATGPRGLLTLAAGKSNVYEILVKTEDNSTTTYKITINIKDNDAEVIDIQTDIASIIFNKETTKYDLGYITKENTSIAINVATQNQHAIVTGDGVHSLVDGINNFVITVTSEDGLNSNTYEITLDRQPQRSSEIGFNDIYVEDAFGMDYITYRGAGTLSDPYLANVPHKLDSINIRVDLIDKNASYAPLKQPLLVGENTVKFVVTAEDGTKSSEYTIIITRKVASSDSSLKELTVKTKNDEVLIGDFNLLPKIEFDSNVYRYDLTLDRSYTSINLAYSTNFIDAIASGPINNRPLQAGELNKFEILVTAEDNSTSTYYINITVKDSDAEVLNIQTDIGELVFNKETTKYDLGYITKENTSIAITVATQNQHAIVAGDGVHALVDGINNFVITVTSEDGLNSNTYEITLDRQPQRSSETGFNQISVEDKFGDNYKALVDSLDDKTYLVTVPYRVDSINILIDLISDKAIFTPQTRALVEGNNNIKIVITAEDGTKSNEYTLLVKREKAADDAQLLDLSLKTEDGELLIGLEELNPTKMIFQSNVHVYDITINRKNRNVDLRFTKSDVNATTSGDEGLINLFPGTVNQLRIQVRSQSGNVKNYFINITLLDDNANVSNIETSINPISFSKDVLKYDLGFITKDNLEILITVTKESQYSIVTGDGLHTLKDGINNFVITVTSEDETNTNVYEITLDREPLKSSEKGFNNVSVTDALGENYVIYRGTGTLSDPYEAIVPYKLDNVNIVIELRDNKATYTPESTLLVVGKNTVKFVITAEDGSKSDEYFIIITREEISSDSSLKDLTVRTNNDELLVGTKNLAPKLVFDSNIFTYELTLDRSYTFIDLAYESNFIEAITSGPVNVRPITGGEINTFEIKVTAEDNSTSVYRVIITVLDSDAEVLNIETSINPISFSKDVLKYDLGFITKDNLEFIITVTTQNQYAVVTGDGVHTLVDGINNFVITVTSEDETNTKTYEITLDRESLKSSEKGFNDIYVTDSFGYDYITFRGDGSLTSPYEAEVPYKLDFVNVEIDLLDINATYTPESTLLVVGKNTVKFVITAEDGSKSDEYFIIITREEISSDSSLKDLTVKTKDGEFLIGDAELLPRKEFDANVYRYELTLDRSYTLIHLAYSTSFIEAIASGPINNRPLIGGETNTFEIKVTAEDNSTSIYQINITVKDGDAEVLDIKTDIGELVFNKETSEYDLGYITKENTSIAITVATQNQHAIVTGDGVHSLVDGINNFVITVTSEDKLNTTRYEITLNRESQKSSETGFNNLYITDAFGNDYVTYQGAGTLSDPYVAKVPYKLDNVNIELDLKDSKASYNPSSTILIVGTNTVKFTVTAEDGTKSDPYIVIITREEISSDSSLKDLTVKTKNEEILIGEFNLLPKIEFNANVYRYDLTLDRSYTFIHLAYSTNFLEAIASGPINNRPLIGGETNTFEIKVTAEDNSTSIYQINITVKDGDAEVLDIKTDIGELVFNKETSEYDLGYITKENTSIAITVATQNQYSTIIGDGIHSLVDGINNFVITVRSEDGLNSNTYEITLERQPQKSSDTNFNEIYVEDKLGEYYLAKVDQLDDKFYHVTVPYRVESIDIIIDLLSDKATYTPHNRFLVEGNNNIKFVITAEDGTKSDDYTLVVTRESAADDAQLIDLTLTTEDGEVLIGLEDLFPTKEEFQSNTYVYDITIGRKHRNLYLSFIMSDSNASSYGDEGLINLIPGTINQLKIQVRSQSGKVKNYYINITVKNSDIEILDITAKGFDELEFNKNTLVYDLGTVEGDITSVDLNAIISDRFGKLEGVGRQPLVDGLNSFIITATSEDETKEVSYEVLIIKKRSSHGALGTDATLYDILVQGTKGQYDLNYQQSEKEYTLNLDYQDDQVFIKGVYEATSTITSEGFHRINAGETKTLSIQVTAQDGTKGAIYTLNINRKTGSDENQLTELIVDVNGELIPLNIEEDYHEIIASNDTTNVDIIANGPKSMTISGDGVKDLKTSEDIFTVNVESETGIKRTYVIKVRRLNNNNNLSDLVVTDKKTSDILEISPVFNKNEQNYTIDLNGIDDILAINIFAKAESQYATIHGDGDKSLKAGTGMTTDRYNIKVTAEDETIKTYVITITRNINPENSIYIDDLTLIGDGIYYLGMSDDVTYLEQFVATNTNYTINVPYNLKNIHLNIINKDGANITGAGTYRLDEKVTTIKFHIVSKSGQVTSEIYTITVIKADASDDNTLSDIRINGLSINEFESNNYQYEMDINLEENETLDVKAFANNKYATISGNTGLILIREGNNNITIRVTAENGDVAHYFIRINAKSDLNEILDIHINGHDIKPSFDKDIKYYTVDVEFDVRTINLNAIASKNATVHGAGIINLDEGDNYVYVYATSQLGTRGTQYTVVIRRTEVSDDATLRSLTVIDAETDEVISYNPEFDPLTNYYVINLPKGNTTKNIIIDAKANNNYATVGGTGFKVLKADIEGVQSNSFEIVIRAQNGDINNYTLAVYYDADLSSLIQIESFEFIGSDGVNYLGTNENAINNFEITKKEYDIVVPYSLRSLSANMLAHAGKVGGDKTKSFGNKDYLEFNVNIQSLNGDIETYIIRVTKEMPVIDNTLSEITIDDVLIKGFSSDVYYYEMDINYENKDTIVIGAKTTDINKMPQGSIGRQNLKMGNNIFTISVISEDGSLQNYTLRVNYVSNNTDINELIVKDTTTDELLKYTFDENKLEYNVSFNKENKEVMIEGISIDNGTIFGDGRLTLDKDVKTRIYLLVTAEDGKTKQRYAVNFIPTYSLSDNTYLEDLQISGFPIIFNKKEKEYHLGVRNDVTNLNINAKPADNNSTVEVLNASSLKEGQNIVRVKVTAENGSVGYYDINVTRDPQPDMFLTVLLILSLLLWIITVLIMLIRKTRDNKRNQDDIIF